MAFVGLLSQIKLLFGPASYSASVVYILKQLFIQVSEILKYSKLCYFII